MSSRKNDYHFGFYDVLPTCGSYSQFPFPNINSITNASIVVGIAEFLFFIIAFRGNNMIIVYGNFSQELGH